MKEILKPWRRIWKHSEECQADIIEAEGAQHHTISHLPKIAKKGWNELNTCAK